MKDARWIGLPVLAVLVTIAARSWVLQVADLRGLDEHTWDLTLSRPHALRWSWFALGTVIASLACVIAAARTYRLLPKPTRILLWAVITVAFFFTWGLSTWAGSNGLLLSSLKRISNLAWWIPVTVSILAWVGSWTMTGAMGALLIGVPDLSRDSRLARLRRLQRLLYIDAALLVLGSLTVSETYSWLQATVPASEVAPDLWPSLAISTAVFFSAVLAAKYLSAATVLRVGITADAPDSLLPALGKGLAQLATLGAPLIASVIDLLL